MGMGPISQHFKAKGRQTKQLETAGVIKAVDDARNSHVNKRTRLFNFYIVKI